METLAPIKLTDKARNIAARYNVNVTQVLQTYKGLVESLSGVGFGKGLDNLTKLAAKAQAIRFDIVGSTKAFTDTFFDPEKAVEASAKMQLLGGKFAQSFGDPMTLAFESMNLYAISSIVDPRFFKKLPLPDSTPFINP